MIFNQYSTNSIASSLQTSSTVKYEYLDGRFISEFNISLKNTGRNSTVLNYFTTILPFQGVENISVNFEGRLLSYKSKKLRDGTELVISFKNEVIQPRDLKSFKLTFNSLSPINSDFGYGKLVTSISGLNVTKVTFEYDNQFPQISQVQGADFKELFSSNNRKYEFSNIISQIISFNIGNPVTYYYEFNKTFVNDGEEAIISEIFVPYTDFKQRFIFSEISPIPIYQRIDNDNNIILGYEIPSKQQVLVNIKGYIQRDYQYKGDIFYNPQDLNFEGYWSIKNISDLNRIDNYLSENDTKTVPDALNSYVLEKLTPVTSSTSKNSFESTTRLGAQSALDRKDFATAEDYVDLLIASLRYKSIPSRMIVGILPESSIYTQEQSFHSWLEFYDSKDGLWRTLDPSLSDIQNLKLTDFESANSIKLLVRSSDALKPKLPFINSEDIIINPIKDTVDTNIKYDLKDVTITNSGNEALIIKNNDFKTVIAPFTQTNLKYSDKYTITTLSGYFEEIETPIKNSINDNNKLYIEIVIFIIFLTSLLIVQSVYVRIKKLWTHKSDSY